MTLRLYLVALIIYAASGSDYSDLITECPSGETTFSGSKDVPDKRYVDLKQFSIKGCSKQPCIFYKTEKFEINALVVLKPASFAPNHTLKSVSVSAKVITPLGPVEIFKGTGTEVCPYVEGDCPNFKTGTEIVIKVSREIEAFIPPFRGGLRVVFREDDKNPIYCATINIILKEKNFDFGDMFQQGFGFGGR